MHNRKMRFHPAQYVPACGSALLAAALAALFLIAFDIALLVNLVLAIISFR